MAHNVAEGARAQSGQRNREALFAASKCEREKMSAETAAYRLGATDAKFATTTTATESQLAQATVGLVSMAEFRKRRQAIEDAEAGVGEEPPAVELKKKKKKKVAVGGLSFNCDDEDGGEVVPQKPQERAAAAAGDVGVCKPNEDGEAGAEDR